MDFMNRNFLKVVSVKGLNCNTNISTVFRNISKWAENQFLVIKIETFIQFNMREIQFLGEKNI